MLDQRRGRWADVVQMLYKCYTNFVFTGMSFEFTCKPERYSVQNQKAVTTYFASKQLLPSGFAGQR